MNEVSFSPDEKYLAGGTKEGTIIVWSVQTGKVHRDISLEMDKYLATYDTKFSPDGKYFAAVGTFRPHKGIGIWSADNFEPIKTITYDTIRPYYTDTDNSVSPRTVSSLYFTPDSKYLITADLEGMIMVWNTNSWNLESSIETEDYIWDITGTKDGKQILSSDGEGIIRFWNFDKGKLQLNKSIKCSEWEITSVAISTDNQYVSTNSSDTLKIIDASTGVNKKSLIVFQESDDYSSIISVDFSSNGKYFASGSTENNLKIWSTMNFNLISTLQGAKRNNHKNETGHNFVNVLFSPTSKYLSMCNDAGYIYIYVLK